LEPAKTKNTDNQAVRPLLLCLSLGCLLACGGGSSSAPTPPVITTGQNSRLAWTVTGANSLSLNDQTITDQGTTVSPAATTTYILKATNAAGSSSASVTVSVGSQGVTYGDMRGADLGAGADLNGAIPFPADNAWNTDISGAEVDPNSDVLIASIGAGTGLHTDFGSGTWDGAEIGIPYMVVDSSQTKLSIAFMRWGDESDPGPYPIPLSAPIEGRKLGGSSFSGDRHVLVIDRDANLLYELDNAFPQSSIWNADCGAVFHLDSDNVRPTAQAGWTSADAAGLPIFALGMTRMPTLAADAGPSSASLSSRLNSDSEWTRYASLQSPTVGQLASKTQIQTIAIVVIDRDADQH